MEKPIKFALPAPNFEKNAPPKSQPYYLTPSGMTLLTREKQPPPMYGPKGSTVSPKFLQQNGEKKPPEEPPKPKPFCEACEMELQSQEDLRRHRSQHERCPVDGCRFKGHPNVMDKHVTELHASGLFDKIKKLSTPEEIAAWREERRRKFPTLANAKMRQLAKEQRERRGERLEENKSRFGRYDDKKRARANEQGDYEKREYPKRVRNKDGNQRKGKDRTRDPKIFRKPLEKSVKIQKPEEPKEIAKEEIHDLSVCGIKMFKGTIKLKDYVHEKKRTEKINNALFGLIGMYGSDDDDEDDGEDLEGDIAISLGDEVIEPLKNDHRLEHVGSEESHREIDKNKTSIEQEAPDPKTCEVQIKTKALNVISKTFKNNESNEQSTLLVVNSNDIKSSSEKVLKEDSQRPNDEGQQINLCTKIVQNDAIVQNASNPNESSDEGPEEAPIQRTTTMPVVEPSTHSTTSIPDQEETIEAKRRRLEQSRKELQDKRTYNFNIRKRKLRKQNTMLEKLLEPEIRHERNILLQCVRFVCENNFFGIGNEPLRQEEKVEENTP